jgi:hypothetical protein
VRRRIAVALFGLLTAGAFTDNAQAQSPVTILAKRGVTVASRAADEANCKQSSQQLQSNVALPVATGVNPVTGQVDTSSSNIIGSAIGGAIVTAIGQHLEQRAAYKACMRALGFVPARLTNEEARAYSKLRNGADRDAWEDAFFRSPRLEVAITPLVPPFPETQREPMIFGAVRVKPESLVVAEGPFYGNGEVVLRGKGRFVAAAELMDDFNFSQKGSTAKASKGDVFYESHSENVVDHSPVTA